MGLIQKHTFGGQRLSVAIAGYGVEGEAIYNYLRSQGGETDITIIDESTTPSKKIPNGVVAILGPEVFNKQLDYDEVWRASPAIAPDRLKTTGQIKTMTQEFFLRCPAPIIGVTGTKGKGTTASLIHLMLKKSGLSSHLVGNIGVPVLEILPKIQSNDIVVFELSSFQLWDLKKSPTCAVVLMIEPDHLDVHKDLEEYIQAKSNISRWQNEDDITVMHPENKISARVGSVGLGQKVRYLTKEGAYIENGRLIIFEQQICSVEEFALLGEHNHENIAAAVTAAWRFTNDKSAISEAIKEFSGLPHRLQIVKEKDQITYVDDSIATTPSATIAAIRAFDQPKIIILGGSDKGSDYSKLANTISNSDIKKALIIGQTAKSIEKSLKKVDFTNYELLSDVGMRQIVQKANDIASSGDVILLSPASASFDMFISYKDRGDQFKKYVDEL